MRIFPKRTQEFLHVFVYIILLLLIVATQAESTHALQAEPIYPSSVAASDSPRAATLSLAIVETPSLSTQTPYNGLDFGPAQLTKLASPAPYYPDASPSEISFEMRSGSTAWLDANKACAPNYDGPHSMWIEVVVGNGSAETLSNTVVDLNGFASTYYELTTDSERYIGTLSPGEAFYAYWYVDYTMVCSATNPFGLSDTFTVTVSSPDLTGDATYSNTLTTDDVNSMASGSVVTSTIAGDIAIGQIFTHSVTYQYGGNVVYTIDCPPVGE